MRPVYRKIDNKSFISYQKPVDETTTASLTDLILAACGNPPSIAQIQLILDDKDELHPHIVYDERDPLIPKILEWLETAETIPVDQMKKIYFDKIINEYDLYSGKDENAL